MDQKVFKTALIGWWVLAASSTLAAQPLKANDFLNSLGVTTKLTQGLDNAAQVIAGLEYTGIRNIRDDATHNPRLYATYCGVHGETGAMIDLLPIVDADPNNIPDTLAQYEAIAACGAMLQAEGPNEPNNFPFVYQGEQCGPSGQLTWAPCANYQRDLYAAVHGDPELAGIQVLNQTEVGVMPDNQGLQFLTIPSGAATLQPDGTEYADVANLHNYVQGHGAKGRLGDNQAWGTEWIGPKLGAWDTLDGEYINRTWRRGFPALPVSAGPSLPKQTTETGWQTGTCSGCIAQDQQGKLFVNVYLTAAKLNWQRTFFYQMFDQTADGSTFGLLVHPPGTTDVIPKLSARYVHNLTSILHDSSSNFEPRPLVYSIAGQSSTIHDLLLEKSDGTYELAVWGDRPVGTLATTVLVDLPTWYPTVNMYDVTIGTAPVARFNDVRTIPLTISDHAVVVEF